MCSPFSLKCAISRASSKFLFGWREIVIKIVRKAKRMHNWFKVHTVYFQTGSKLGSSKWRNGEEWSLEEVWLLPSVGKFWCKFWVWVCVIVKWQSYERLVTTFWGIETSRNEPFDMQNQISSWHGQGKLTLSKLMNGLCTFFPTSTFMVIHQDCGLKLTWHYGFWWVK